MMKLFTCICFHFKREKLQYLQQVLYMQQFLADEVHVCIITNTVKETELNDITSVAPQESDCFHCEIFNHTLDQLPSPWLLPWAHKPIMLQRYQEPTFTHFMYMEDDLAVTPVNMDYWLQAREDLRPFRLYPSFLRVEWSDLKNDWVSIELLNHEKVIVANLPRLQVPGEGRSYFNFPRPYQGMFLYDRELMAEHIASKTFNFFESIPDYQSKMVSNWGGGIAEAASWALTFTNVPTGYTSRNALPYFPKYQMIDPRCFVHHLPDKYANMDQYFQGHVLVRDILRPRESELLSEPVDMAVQLSESQTTPFKDKLRTIVSDYQIIVSIPPGNYHFNRGSVALKQIVNYIPKDKTKVITLLDIGFGLGGLGQLVKTHPDTGHWQVDGIDGFFDTCCNLELFNKKYYRNIWHGLASDIPSEQLQSYDILCLFDVIEYLDPFLAKKLLASLLGALGPNSYLALSTPLWFMPQDQMRPGDLEEHRFGVPAASLLRLAPIMYYIPRENLVGTFVFSKKSLEHIDHFTVTTDKSFDFAAGIQHLSSLGIQANSSKIYFVQ